MAKIFEVFGQKKKFKYLKCVELNTNNISGSKKMISRCLESQKHSNKNKKLQNKQERE
jgi:hypothetical protein